MSEHQKMEKIRENLQWLVQWIRTHELVTVVLLGIVGVGCLGFLELGDEVMEGESAKFDRAILLSLRTPVDSSDPIGPRWVEEAARDITALGSNVVLLLLTLGTVGYLWITKQNWIAVFVLVAVLSGVGVSQGMKVGFDRPRPNLVPHKTEVYTKSFPSGHSSLSAIVFLTLAALLARLESSRKVQLYLLGLAGVVTFLVGLSRVYLGVHWPTDILGGWIFGSTWAAASWLLFRAVKRWHRHRVRSSSSP